jgi:hypothetical protein
VTSKECGLEGGKFHPLYEADYVMHCIGNFTKENFCVNMFIFPTGVRILEVC